LIMGASAEILEIISPGLGLTLQDGGRFGWRKFGVPASGAMDDHAADCANRLLENPRHAPVLELLFQGAKFLFLRDVWIAVTGAEARANVKTWQAHRVRAGETLEFPHNQCGVWIYVAIEGGFMGERLLGSASVYPRGQLGKAFARGDRLRRNMASEFHPPSAIARRLMAVSEIRNYSEPPPLRIWRGPQWEFFREPERAAFFTNQWTVSAQSDRIGYRFSGERIQSPSAQMVSEPVRVGTIQVPENGQPIVTMRDGPTVGGYPKLGMVDPADLSWLAQSRPGQKIRFQLIEASNP
jgi:biotin-dependent carboxylase-like uncharacterized protein